MHFFSFMLQLKESSSQTTLRRFIPSYERYLEAVLYEAADRESHIIRGSIDDYLALRRYTGAIKPSFDLILLPVEIPDEVLLDPRIVNLEMIAIDMVAVANVGGVLASTQVYCSFDFLGCCLFQC